MTTPSEATLDWSETAASEVAASDKTHATIDKSTDWARSIPFLSVHVAAIAGLFLVPITLKGILTTLGMYCFFMIGITSAFHRYFSHRTYKTSRPFQFLLALWGTATAQRGALSWAAHHRHHHRFSDQPEDVHSPTKVGFFWAHVGWIMAREYEGTRWEYVRDLSRYPELRWLNEHYLVPVVTYAVLTFLIGGWAGFYWAFILMLTLLWHCTFTINSFMHLFGKRRFNTTDTSRNSLLFALITMGEGWHNNHHHYMNAANQGIYWWEIDVSYYVIKTWEKLGLVWDVRKTPQEIVALGRTSTSS